MDETERGPKKPVTVEYLESYVELKKSVNAHQENQDIPILICCDVKEYQEEYGKELVSILQARRRLEDFINGLEQETAFLTSQNSCHTNAEISQA